MQKSTMNWDDVRLFLALARNGSARAAATALGVSHTTIARRAEDLEKDLSSRLFERDVSGYRLTGAGEALLSQAVRAEDALLAAERQLQGRDAQLSGEIVLTTSDLIAQHLLMDDLVEFTRRYPDIDLNILLSYDVYDLGRREADIAIRFIGPGRRPPEDLVGRKLSTAFSCYYASERYLAEHDPYADDTRASWIGWNDDTRFPEWVRASPFPDLPTRGKINNAVLQGEAARQGMGLATLPCFMGDSIAGLKRVANCKPYSNYDIWLLSHPDLRDAAKLRTFRSFIVDVFEAKGPLLRGERPR